MKDPHKILFHVSVCLVQKEMDLHVLIAMLDTTRVHVETSVYHVLVVHIVKILEVHNVLHVLLDHILIVYQEHLPMYVLIVLLECTLIV
jgi:hypothetical protein